MDYSIRNERTEDYRTVEEVTRRAFWNVHAPGCSEHYLVHTMRSHEDFVPELDFVLEKDGAVIGNIVYTKGKIVSEGGIERQVLSFGPVSILPEFQRRGYGKILIEHSFQRAVEMGYGLVVIFGSPSNYVSLGFQSGARYSIGLANHIYPSALLVKVLNPGVLEPGTWVYQESDAYQIDLEEAQAFDLTWEPMEKKVTPRQEEFFILSQSTIRLNR